MKIRVGKICIGLMMMCLSYGSMKAAPMQLVYDGQTHIYNEQPIGLYVDSRKIETEQMPPIQLNGYTLVPAREVFEETGATVLWKESEQKVYVDNGTQLIVLEINNQTAWVNDQEKTLDMPAKVINSKVMIPARFVGETLGYEVKWERSDNSVQIFTQGSSPNQGNTGNTDNTGNTGNQENTDDITPSVTPAGDGWLNLEHIAYVKSEESLKLTGIEGLTAADIKVNEQYQSKQIIINLNQDYSSYLPAGKWFKQQGAISVLEIRHLDVGTQIVLTTRQIQALKVTEDNGSIVLKSVKPSAKYDKIVVVDAGHGYQDAGASAGGVKEKDLNLKYALALKQVLEQNPDIQVYLTRSDDTFLELSERTKFANEIDPDLFISIHINSAENAAATGTETYYTVKSDTRNKTFATMVQKALIDTFGTRNRGVKSNIFYVTRYTNAPAILIEIGFITNTQDRNMMTSTGFAEEYAGVLYRCILDYFAQGLNN